MKSSRRKFLTASLGSVMALRGASLSGATVGSSISDRKDTGYRGIWFALGQRSEYGDKYSGGLGTYTANHVPMAIYSKEAEKTFFVYGGAKEGKRHLLAMASYYDHRLNRVPRPTVVHDKKTVNDPHDNPSLCIDGNGHLWVFVSGRARARPGFIYRSVKPWSTDAFELIAEREFTYPQPRWVPGHGFLFLFTKYTKGRELYFSTSPDGRSWSEDHKFAGIGGHYQTSHQRGSRIITAFNMHPGGNVDKRTNMYFLYTEDFAATWRNALSEPVELPLTNADNPALVRDYLSEKRLVYIHDLDLDENQEPAILYTTSSDHRPGPPGDPRWWTVARSTKGQWQYDELTRANHNYTTGSLIRKQNSWQVTGPTEPGPQPIGSGGEVAIWNKLEGARKWNKQRQVTKSSTVNHNYVRRVMNAHPDFAAFWADGNPETFSPSSLYFMNAEGDKVWRLPYNMDKEFAEPALLDSRG